jgi:hypothetical protein
MNETTLVTPEILALSNSISTLTDGCRFMSLTYKAKETGEVARHTLLVGFSYIEMVKDSVEQLTAWMEYMSGDELFAAQEVMKSLRKTLDAKAEGKQNEDYTKKGMYAPVRGGVNINLNDNSIQLFGRTINKTVLEKGVYKTVNSKPLTIAKDKIKKYLPVSKFREFALDKNVVLSGKNNGETFDCVTPECAGFELNPTVTVPLAPVLA